MDDSSYFSPLTCFNQPPPPPPPPPVSHYFPEINSTPPPPLSPPPTPPPSHYFPEIDQTPYPSANSKTDQACQEETTTVHVYSSEGPQLPSSSLGSQITLPAEPGLDGLYYNKSIVKIHVEGNPNLHVTVKGERTMLAPADPFDPSQYWYKDERYKQTKDAEGFSAFALVNKATGQVLDHSPGSGNPVQLRPYNPNIVDEYVLWTESKDSSDGYRLIRTFIDLKGLMNASGGSIDGRNIIVWPGNGAPNERWRMTTHKKFLCKQTSQGSES